MNRAGAPSSAEDWFTLPRLFVLLALFVFLAFPGIILGSESLFYRDMGVFGYPLAHYHRAAFWRGEIPLWNPFNNCGVPFLAQWNTLVLYPGALIYLLLPLPWSMNLFVFAHVFLAAAGTYALARRWTGNCFAASVAGLLFAWNGLTLHALMWPNNIAALGWMPWVVLALERAWSQGGARRVMVGTFAGAIQMLSGAPEIILFTWSVAGLLCARDVLRAPGSRWKMAGRLMLCGTMMASLCAAQLLPFLELLRQSNRDASFGGNAYALPLWGWANFFVPLFGCTPSVIGVYSQDEQQWTSSYYLGVVTLAFALLAWRARDSRVKWLTAVAIGGLLLALGENGFVYSVLKRAVPALGFIRFPIKYVVLIAFALPLLAAFGVSAWQQGVTAATARRRLWLAVAPVLIAILAVAAWAWLRPLVGTEPRLALVNGLWRALFVLAVSAALIFSQRSHRAGMFSRLAILVLLAADVLTHTPRQNPTVINRAFGALPPDMSAAPKPGESRAMISPPLQFNLERLAFADAFTFFRTDRRMLLHDCNLMAGVPKVNGFFSLYVRAGEEVMRQLYRRTNYANLPLLDFLGVSQLSSADWLFEWNARTTALPLVTAGQRPVFAPTKEIFDGLFSERFVPRDIVFLPETARGQVFAVRNACRVLSSEVRAQRITATVQASAPSLVVFAQTDFPAWRAFVDGAPVRLWRANHAFQAVVVPAGEHRVELRYVDRAFRTGAAVSLATLLACVTAWAVVRWRARQAIP